MILLQKIQNYFYFFNIFKENIPKLSKLLIILMIFCKIIILMIFFLKKVHL